MLYLGGVGLSLFLTLLLLSKRHKTVPDYLLAVWLGVITLHLLLFYFVRNQLYPWLLGFDIPIPLLHGPLLYAYTASLTSRMPSGKIMMLHFVPPAAIFVYTLPFLILPATQKIYVYEHHGAGYETFNFVKDLLVMTSGVFYIILSSVVLKKHRSSIVNEFSNTERINLEWLQYLIYWIGAIWIFVIVGNDTLVFGAAVLFVAFIGFFGIRQVGIFHSTVNPSSSSSPMKPSEVEHPEQVPELEKRKYQKSGLSPTDAQQLHTALTQLMIHEKPFRESELSLSDLATRLHTQSNYLSQVINEREGKNFYDYINTLRMEEFLRIAAAPESRRYTLLALAQECGFNSKSSFNRYCKKITGKLPSEVIIIQEDTL